MRVLVLDGNENQAVACTRSLCRAGHTVIVGASTSWSKGGWSRACARRFKYPAPEEDSEAFVHGVAEEAAQVPDTLVLPMTERTTLPLSLHREVIFAAGGRLVLPPHETVVRAFDKAQTTQLAHALGVRVPKTILIANPVQARAMSEAVCYPVVLKPRTTERFSARGAVTATGTPEYARERQGFLDAYARMSVRCDEILVQEFVEGTGTGYFALMRKGELQVEFAHRRLRDVRPTGSGSSLRVSTKPEPAVREAALAILRALNWHGVAMVEFRVRADGTPVFMEVNGRFWHSLALAIYAGVDFPALLVRMVQDDIGATMPEYQTGIRCRWLLGDFRHLIEVWRGAPAGYPGRFPSRLSTLAAFFTPVRGTYHDNFQLFDPLPELGDWLYFWIRRVPAALRKRSAELAGQSAERRYSHP